MKRVRVIGSQQNHREYLYEALQLAASGKVRVKTEVFPFDKIQEAYKKVEEGKVRFRAVVAL
jgi:D-arabinose 1-dehydrogenase-like Zn-dependent alcohol dehydrogenase